MHRLPSHFPPGFLGAGLLALRLLLAVRLVTVGEPVAIAGFHDAGWTVAVAGVLLLICGALGALGFLTRAAQTTAAVVELTLATGHFTTIAILMHLGDPWTERLVEAVMAAGLALTGPGGYSIDARLFGRHEIIIPSQVRSIDD